MKKRLLALFLTCGMAFSSVSAFAAAENIIIDGNQVNIPADMGSIKELDDRTFVPVRFVSEYLNYNVKYGSTTVNGVLQESATITDQANNSFLIIRGNPQLFVLPSYNSGMASGPITMDTAAFIDDAEDRFYIPIRFLAEAMGYEVGWDEATQTVSLTKK